MSEMSDVYTIHRERTGAVWQRDTPIPEGACHLTVHVCLFNRDGAMLIQQRSSTRDVFPNAWDVTVAGHVQAGETSRMAAMRELKEELGLTLDLTERRPHLTFHAEGAFDDVFLMEADVALEDVSLQEEEVQAVCYADEATIVAWMNDGRFVPYRPEIVSLLFAMRHTYGSFQRVDEGGI